MIKRSVRIVTIYLLTISALLLSCTSADSEKSGIDATQEPNVLFREILQFIPEDFSTEWRIGITNHEWIRNEFNIPLPPEDAGTEVVNQYLEDFLNAAVKGEIMHMTSATFISGIFGIRNPIRYENIGFGPQNVDMDVWIYWKGMEIELIIGKFDLDAIDKAIDRLDDSVKPVRTSYKDYDILDWGGSSVDLDKVWAPPVFDNIGRGGFIAVKDDCIMRSIELEHIEQLIDVREGDILSLADNPDFTLVTDMLADMGARNIMFSDIVHSASALPENADIDHETLLDAFNVIGSGIGEDELGNYAGVALVFSDPQIAEMNIEKLEKQLISEDKSQMPGKDIDEYEITAEGRTLKVILRGNIIKYGAVMLMSSLFMVP